MNQEHIDPPSLNVQRTAPSDVPRQDSVVSARENLNETNASFFSGKRLLLLLLVSIGILLLPFSWYLLSARAPMSQSEQVPQQDLTQNSPGLESESLQVAPSSDVVIPVQIDIQWQDDQLSYDVQQVYSVPEPAATASMELAPSDQLVVFAVQVVDTRTFGAARVVPARTYVNVRRHSQDFLPMGVDTVELLPGESKTVYVPFALPETEQQVTGLLGNLRNPYVVELDFAQGQALHGSFDLEQGFLPASPASSLPTDIPTVGATESAQ